MEDISIFQDLTTKPTEKDLEKKLVSTYKWWIKIKDFVLQLYPTGLEEWSVPVKKYGWVYKIKDKKRAIIYLSPRDGFFKTTFVFGQKATDAIMASDISPNIKDELETAKVYMEGRVQNMVIKNGKMFTDIKKLIAIKLQF